MVAGKLGKVTNEKAAAWFEADAMVWAAVGSPYVLVQAEGSMQVGEG